MNKFDFQKELKKDLEKELVTPDREWNIRGFIDISKKIYPLSLDTKLLSKIIELTVIPMIIKFVKKHQLKLYLAEHQLQYPDITLEGKKIGNKKYAVDIKTTYRTGNTIKRGFTLGSFRGSLRSPFSTRYSRFPYSEYAKHWVLGIIYTRREKVESQKFYSIKDLSKIKAVIRDIEVILQEKYKIANYVPGSGNTANIGSVTNLEMLRNGTGPFAKHGDKVFLDYWINYLRREDAERKGLERPYRNLEEYFEWKRSKRST
ncbi:restriction endonuclease [candidate division WOR-3 bacterium]|nr:restriction endonuclease [candidate division WOR-3 bacterium]